MKNLLLYNLKNYLNFIYFCFYLFYILNAQTLEKSRSVWVEQGLVRGKIYKINSQKLQIFRGIPYAEPPIGPLRFKVFVFLNN